MITILGVLAMVVGGLVVHVITGMINGWIRFK